MSAVAAWNYGGLALAVALSTAPVWGPVLRGHGIEAPPSSAAPAATVLEDHSGQRLVVGHYERIASLSTVADELLLALCEPDRIAAVTRYSARNAPNAYRFAEVKSVTADGPHKVVLTLKQPTPDLLTDIGGFMGVAIVQQKNVESGQIAQHPVGTGPYKLVSWDHGLSITLAANPHYWGGAPKIPTIKYEFVSNPTVALQDLEGGEVQWTDNLPPQQVQSLQKSSNSFTVKSVPSTDYWYMTLNEARKPYNDARVRQAIAYAINRNAIVEAATYGNAAANQTAIPKTSQWYYDYAPYTTDLSKAKSLLAQAGVKSLTMNMMVTSEYPQTVTAAQVIAAELQPLGITVKIQTLDPNTANTNFQNEKYDMTLSLWTMDIPDPDELATFGLDPKSGAKSFFTSYDNPTVVKDVHEAEKVTTPATRQSLYNTVQTDAAQDAFMAFLYYSPYPYVTSSSVHGFFVTPLGNYHMENVWMSK